MADKRYSLESLLIIILLSVGCQKDESSSVSPSDRNELKPVNIPKKKEAKSSVQADFVKGKRIHYKISDENAESEWIQLNANGTFMFSDEFQGTYSVEGLTIILMKDGNEYSSTTLQEPNLRIGSKLTVSGSGNDMILTVLKVEETHSEEKNEDEGKSGKTPEADTESRPNTLDSAKVFENTLGMKFVSVPGTEVQFCIWETRGKDYATYAAANVEVNERWKNPAVFKQEGFKQTDTHPVVEVSWEDAQAFCAWLTKKELAEGKIKARQKYRLPTDAEWSVAVGLGKEKGATPEKKALGIEDVYPWGKEYPPPKGVGNYRKSLKVDEFEHTAPVGSFPANRHGLHDMGGNVSEWCDDKFKPNGPFRVVRGASWDPYDRDGGHNFWSSNRRYTTPDSRNRGAGFRCVLVGE